MPPGDSGDWERWRGGTSEALAQIIAGIERLGHQFENHEHQDNERFGKIDMELGGLKTKVAWWSGAAAAVGAVAGWIASWVVDKK